MAHKSYMNHLGLSAIQQLTEMPSFSSSELITFFFPSADLCILFLSGIFRNPGG